MERRRRPHYDRHAHGDVVSGSRRAAPPRRLAQPDASRLPMPIVTYGDRGRPLLLFPTAAADYLENERFFLVKAVEPLHPGRPGPRVLDRQHQQPRVDGLDGAGARAGAPPGALRALHRGRGRALHPPRLRRSGGAHRHRPAPASAPSTPPTACAGAPTCSTASSAMSGFYDLEPDYLKGYSDDNCYFNNPAWYLRELSGRAATPAAHGLSHRAGERARRLRGPRRHRSAFADLLGARTSLTCSTSGATT